ncbi:oligosaccharide flippase family protein [Rasiella sp. SM2506]|uniref:oligosaccharide flippase family protein n=1 Tax=Rasiella sp. SM2506 TaxID=3423914 RepID=UPI003D7B16C1
MKQKNKIQLVYKSQFVKKVVQGTFWLTFGSVMAKGLTALAYLVLARILTVSAYGEYGMVKSTIDNFLIFASMGVGLTATKYISELKDENKQKASNILGASLVAVFVLSLVVFLVLLFFSNTIATSILENPSLTMPLILAGGVLLFISVNGVVNGALLGLQRYRKISVINILQGFLLFGLLSLGGYFYGVVGAVGGNLIAMGIVCVISFFMLKSSVQKIDMSISLKKFKESLKTIYKFAIPASLGMLIVAPTIWILNTLLVNTTNGYTELGIYSAVLVFSLAIRTVNTSLSDALLPMFLDKNMEITPKKEFFNYHGAWIICLGISLPFILFPEIASYILGQDYPKREVVLILEMSVLMTLFLSVKQGLSRDLIKKNKMWLSVLSTGIFAATTFVFFLFLKEEGAIGFAIAFLVGHALSMLLAIPLFIYLKVTHAYNFKSIWFIVISILLGVLIMNSVYNEHILARVAVSLLVVVLLVLSLLKFYRSMIRYSAAL